MAPYSDVCSVDAFGPCLTNALELTGDTLQLAALAADESVPRMLPPQYVRQPNFMQEEVKVAIASVSAAPAPPAPHRASPRRRPMFILKESKLPRCRTVVGWTRRCRGAGPPMRSDAR